MNSHEAMYDGMTGGEIFLSGFEYARSTGFPQAFIGGVHFLTNMPALAAQYQISVTEEVIW